MEINSLSNQIEKEWLESLFKGIFSDPSWQIVSDEKYYIISNRLPILEIPEYSHISITLTSEDGSHGIYTKQVSINRKKQDSQDSMSNQESNPFDAKYKKHF